MSKFHFVLLALCTWRISNMLVKENGPSYIFEHLRHWAGKKDSESFLATLLACSWCLSVWVASAFTMLFAFNRRIAQWAAMPFALSAIACIIDRWDGWSDR